MSQARNMRRQLFTQGMMPRGTPRRVAAHRQVYDTALGMAHEVYADLMAADNELYADWKKQCPDLTPAKCEELFCELLVPKLLEPARATLAAMLGMPAYKHLHESIYDALIKDNILRPGRNAQRGRQHVVIEGEGKTRH